MSVKDYPFIEGKFEVTAQMREDFDQKGYLLVRNLLSKEEVDKIRGHLERSDVIKQYAFDVDDGAGKKSRMCLWNQPGSDLTGMLARSEKVVTTCEQLLGGEVYHYHTKLMMKEPFSGGRWAWHQDYGYWYHNTCLFPNMMTVFVAMDACRQDNGCLQVMEGSHRCGRVDHVISGDQSGADTERVEFLKQRFPTLSVELEPGDALFFHCNLLHASSQNEGPNRRWALAVAYNRADNDPVVTHHHPHYTKLNKVPNSAIVASAEEWDVAHKDFFTTAVFRKQQDVMKGKDKY
ncbi:L-proline trans-4-hydroxylase-like [Babylonia areolata]|uniref:L-proline trans-4-hydroxylase-like n=1 Tax=Babylonia areolata TaxID=304850 RepID=UPI003FCF71A2